LTYTSHRRYLFYNNNKTDSPVIISIYEKWSRNEKYIKHFGKFSTNCRRYLIKYSFTILSFFFMMQLGKLNHIHIQTHETPHEILLVCKLKEFVAIFIIREFGLRWNESNLQERLLLLFFIISKYFTFMQKLVAYCEGACAINIFRLVTCRLNFL
jgi:hypothetical protein